jgi:hypothetical protein
LNHVLFEALQGLRSTSLLLLLLLLLLLPPPPPKSAIVLAQSRDQMSTFTPAHRGWAGASAVPICRNFARDGRCPFGAGCRFRHEQPRSERAAKAAAAFASPGGSAGQTEGDDSPLPELDARTRRWLDCCSSGDSLPHAGFEFTFVT